MAESAKIMAADGASSMPERHGPVESQTIVAGKRYILAVSPSGIPGIMPTKNGRQYLEKGGCLWVAAC